MKINGFHWLESITISNMTLITFQTIYLQSILRRSVANRGGGVWCGDLEQKFRINSHVEIVHKSTSIVFFFDRIK